MRIAVMGTGYVGLVSGVCFSQLGFHVTCIDRIPEKIAMLKKGVAPFYEPGLAEMMTVNRKAGRLSFVTSLDEAEEADVIFIAVGTPPGPDGLPDMSALMAVGDAIEASKHKRALVVVKSTVPPGTTRALGERLSTHETASNPEFLREGTAIADFMQPDRIVCGVMSERARAIMEKLYAPLNATVFFTGPESSEMIKYASNDLLATRIAYINEMADICEAIGADIADVAEGMGMDKRIGPFFLKPGPGFGGSCFPKDVLALAEIAERAGCPSRLLDATLESNHARKVAMAKKVITACGGSVKGKTLAVLGLTFKADTDDMREAPSLVIVPELLKAGAKLRAFDPEGRETAGALLKGDIAWCADAEEALRGADAAVILTEWAVFKTLEPEQIRALLKTPLVVDLRNLFAPEAMEKAGLVYVSVGRPAVGKFERVKAEVA